MTSVVASLQQFLRCYQQMAASVLESSSIHVSCIRQFLHDLVPPLVPVWTGQPERLKGISEVL